MQSIKKLLKRTLLYEAYRKHRIRRAYRPWTSHDQEMLEFYSGLLSRDEVCFDVGANFGNRVRIFLKLHARVIAVEPQSECVKVIKVVYGRRRGLIVVQKALGEAEGEAQMMISSSPNLSSLSAGWIEAVRKSGRFSSYTWDTKQVVAVTTLDRLIQTYGVPAFIKIDVEGFEYQVVKGLTRPVRMLSLEFTPEFMESTFRCIDHLRTLGEVRLNYSVRETMRFSLDEWVTHQEMSNILSGFHDNELYGDVYVKFQS